MSVLNSGQLHDGERQPDLPVIRQGLLQNLGGYVGATATGSTTISCLAQLLHIAYAVIHRIADVRIGYCIADTHVHKAFLLFLK